MVVNFFAEGRHLVVDAVVTIVYRNTILKSASTILGYAAKQVEEHKLLAYRASSQPISASELAEYCTNLKIIAGVLTRFEAGPQGSMLRRDDR